MKQKAQALLKALLWATGRSEELSHFLPASLAADLPNVSIDTKTFDITALFSSYSWSLPIHYSWFSQAIRDYPPDVQPLFLTILTQPQAEGVRSMLELPKQEKKPSSFVRPFLMDILHKSLQDSDILGEQLLPESPLNRLLSLDRMHLFHLADLLGLYDLAADLRQVVDKQLLQKIYTGLSQERKQFLQYCAQQPMKWVSPKLGLLAWDGSQKQLNYLLHYRGLIRLAKAVVQESPSYKWHLLHRYDTGRAKIIQKEFYKKQDLALVSYFKNQVLHIAERYQKKMDKIKV